MSLESRGKDITLIGGQLRVFRFNGENNNVIVSANGCFALHLPRDKAQELAAAILLIASDDPVEETP